MSPSNHSSRNPVKPAQVGALPLQQESQQPATFPLNDASTPGTSSSGPGPLSGPGPAGGGIGPDSGSRAKRQAARSGLQVSRTDQLPAGLGPSSSTTTVDVDVNNEGNLNGSTTPLGFLAWSVSGIMASLLAYGWGGSLWRSKTIDEQLDEMLFGLEGEGGSVQALSAGSGLLYGWDIKRLLFWWLVLVVFCVIGERRIGQDVG